MILEQTPGKFSVVKMDIEGVEGRLIKGNWLNSVREIAMELHGNENVISIPAMLRDKGFNVRFMKWSDVVKKFGKEYLFILSGLSYSRNEGKDYEQRN